METPKPLTPTRKEQNRVNQKRFREKHFHERKQLRERYEENEWRRKLGLEVKP